MNYDTPEGDKHLAMEVSGYRPDCS